MSARYCPSCGHDFASFDGIIDGRFSYSPASGFCIDGERLDAPAQVHKAMGAVMSAHGLCVGLEPVAEQMGYHGDDPSNIVKVRMTHARRAVTSRGVAFPIETLWGRGLRWNPDAQPRGPVRHRVAPVEQAAA